MKILRLTENRFAWAALLAAPFLAGWVITKTPDMRGIERDRRDAARRADARRRELSPPDAVEARPALLSLARRLAAKGFTPNVLEQKFRVSGLQNPIMAASPSVAGWLAKLDASIGPELDGLAAIYAKAQLPEPTVAYESGTYSTGYNALNPWVAPLAVARAARGDWDGALRLHESEMIRVGKPSETFYTNEGLRTAYVFLQLKPPAGVCRRLSAMMRMARTAPGAWTRHGMGLGVRQMFGSPLPEFSRATVTAISQRLNADADLIDRMNAPDNPESRGFQSLGWWGDNGQSGDWSGQWNPTGSVSSLSGLIPWTSVYSDFRDARRALARHPELGGSLYGASPAALQGLDPLATAAVYGGTWRLQARLFMANQTRYSVTSLWLREIAFAARAYRIEKGVWPGDLKALVPDYLPGLPDPLLSSVPSPETAKAALAGNFAISRQPLGPLRCGEVAVGARNVADWVPVPATDRYRQPIGDQAFYLSPQSRVTSGTPPDGGPVWTSTQSYQREWAVRMAALVGRLMPNDAVTSVVVSGMTNFRAGDVRGNLQMALTADEVAAIAAAGDESETGTMSTALETLTRGGAPRAVKWKEFLAAANNLNSVVNLQFRAPGKAFAVWSPGGDGVDDGGLESQHLVPKLGRTVGDTILFVPE